MAQKELAKRGSELEIPPPDDMMAIAAFFLEGAPKARDCMSKVNEMVVKWKRKIILWTAYPGSDLLLSGICQLFKLPYQVLHAKLVLKDRDVIRQKFDSKPDGLMTLICNYKVGAFGQNLQHNCSDNYMFDPPLNDSIRYQAIGRTRRKNARSDVVTVTEGFVNNTFQSRIRTLTLRKVLPMLFVDFNRPQESDFDSATSNFDIDGSVLGRFVEYKSEVRSVDDPEVADLNLPLLEPEELLALLRLHCDIVETAWYLHNRSLDGIHNNKSLPGLHHNRSLPISESRRGFDPPMRDCNRCGDSKYPQANHGYNVTAFVNIYDKSNPTLCRACYEWPGRNSGSERPEAEWPWYSKGRGKAKCRYCGDMWPLSLKRAKVENERQREHEIEKSFISHVCSNWCDNF